MLVLPVSQAFSAEYPAVDCVVQPYRVVDLGSPVAGVIEEVLVERSDFVRIGQQVARLEGSVEHATVKLARARTKVDAQLQSETVNVEFDEKFLKRIDSLYGRKVIPIDNKDAADRDLELSKWRLEQVKDLQEVRNLELERAKELVEQKIIRSTIDGFVLNRFKSQGEFVEDQPILRIAQLDPLNIEAMIPMKYFGLIKPGMLAEVHPEIVSASLHDAVVRVVDRVGDAASGTFGVRLEMSNPGFEIPAGLKCEVKFLPKFAAAVPDEVNLNQVTESPPQQQDEATPDAMQPVTYSLGPFVDDTAFLEAKQSVQGMTFSEREASIASVRHYMVITTETGEEPMGTVLENAGIQDFKYVRAGKLREHYSVGIYSTEQRANERVKVLQNLGIAAEVSSRFSGKITRWLDVEVSSEPQIANIERLRAAGYSVQKRTR